MMFCKNCDNWRRHSSQWDIEHKNTHAGKCLSPKFVYSCFIENPPTDGLMYSDNAEDQAHFCTGEDFGCVHWEEKK